MHSERILPLLHGVDAYGFLRSVQENVFDNILLVVHVGLLIAEVGFVDELLAGPDHVLLVQPDDEADGKRPCKFRADVRHFVPGFFMKTNYASTGRRVIFRPACSPFFLPTPAKLPNIYLEELFFPVSWNNVQYFNITFLEMYSVLNLASGNYLGFPATTANFNDNSGQEYAI